jgi:hypothetical protein
MSHRDYIADRERREPRFAAERQVAAAELTLGEALVHRRHQWNLTFAQLAEQTGIPEDRLEAIEEGESMTFHEVMWLLHALEVSLSIGPDFDLAIEVPTISRRSVG